MRIGVIGCGYLGATHAACMAELGHEVMGLDKDPRKLDDLASGRVPFHEPELEDVLRRNVHRGRLRFTNSMRQIAEFADVQFLCVGTPQRHDSLAADTSHVESAVAELAPLLDRPCLVVGKSTVPVGTAAAQAEVLRRLAPAGRSVELAWNPEFVREGHAVRDTMQPDRLVFGVSSGSAEAKLRRVYVDVIAEGAPVLVTDMATAELVKSSANAFLATKISFVNAVAEICQVSGADIVELAEAIGMDPRIGPRFLHAGLGFGGGCLPKDIRAFVHRAGELGVGNAVRFLDEVDAINQRQRQHVVDAAKTLLSDVGRPRVAVLGAAFKPNSDDIRDSPALWVAGQLHLVGATVTVYDPQALQNARSVFPTLDYADSALKACQDADLVLHLTEWQEFRRLAPSDLSSVVARQQIIDGRNCLDADSWRQAGWTFRALGRRPTSATAPSAPR